MTFDRTGRIRGLFLAVAFALGATATSANASTLSAGAGTAPDLGEWALVFPLLNGETARPWLSIKGIDTANFVGGGQPQASTGRRSRGSGRRGKAVGFGACWAGSCQAGQLSGQVAGQADANAFAASFLTGLMPDAGFSLDRRATRNLKKSLKKMFKSGRNPGDDVFAYRNSGNSLLANALLVDAKTGRIVGNGQGLPWQWLVSERVPPVEPVIELESAAVLPSGAVTAIPLPAALPLFAGAVSALGLLGWHRRRRAAI